MHLEQLDPPGGGLLTEYLRGCVDTRPQAMERPTVLGLPGRRSSQLSARRADPAALRSPPAG